MPGRSQCVHWGPDIYWTGDRENLSEYASVKKVHLERLVSKNGNVEADDDSVLEKNERLSSGQQSHGRQSGRQGSHNDSCRGTVANRVFC